MKMKIGKCAAENTTELQYAQFRKILSLSDLNFYKSKRNM